MAGVSLDQLEQQFAVNTHRMGLLTKFKDELLDWQAYLTELRIWLFGSYLTDKDQPGDIDVLLAGRLKPGTPLPPKLPRKYRDDIHVMPELRFGIGELASKEQLVQKFNEDEGNMNRGIQISVHQVIDLLL